MTRQKRTVVDNGVEVIFKFDESTIQVGDSNLPDLLKQTAPRSVIDGVGAIWFTTKNGVDPTFEVEKGGIASENFWTLLGNIKVGTTPLYVWECTGTG